MEEPVISDMFTAPSEESDKSEIIKIIGVGGAGGNAVNNMYRMGIKGVNYVICNTDNQALINSPVKTKIQIGKRTTEGLGAGNNPEVGRTSALEDQADIEAVLDDNTRMVFVTAGMGGGTGTGAAPVIAKLAKDRGILTVGIVTLPYKSEGRPRLKQAILGATEMAASVDSLLVIHTGRLKELFGRMTVKDSFAEADKVLAYAAKGIAELITVHRTINVDFADVKTCLTDSGCAVMGTGEAEGDDRAMAAVEKALHSPLLNNSDIEGATSILVNITSHPSNPTLQDELGDILDYLFERAGGSDNEQDSVIWGLGEDETLKEGALRVTVVATGFSTDVFEIKSKKDDELSVDLAGHDRRHVAPAAASDEETERSQSIDLTDPDVNRMQGILESLYGEGGKSSCTESKPVSYSTKSLRDATCLPLESLNEETLKHIENVPAYARRQV